jgi:hypothetical protein
VVADAIEDLYVLLTGDAAPLLASFTEVTAAGEEMAAAVTASLAEVKAAMAGSLAGMDAGAAGGAGIAALGAEADAAAAQVATAAGTIDSELGSMGITAKATAAEVQTAFTEMGASLAATTERMTVLSGENGAMLAKMKADNVALAASASEANLSTAAVGDAMAGTSAKAAAANTTLGMSNTLLMGLGVTAIGTAYEAVKMGGDFQASVTKLATTAGEAQGNLKMVSDGILSMAGQVGYSSGELAKAMYTVESGGQHGADALKVLTAAAQGAKSEQADLTTVTDAVTSALTDYHLNADQAATVTSKLVAATGAGKMTFEQLAASMSAILPVASANHVALNDILGDLASMTMHGMSAEQASQNLADAIRHMASPTQAQSKELAALGMNATEVSKSLGDQGLSGTINEISQRITSQMGPDGMVVVNLTNALKGMSPAVQALGEKVLDGSMTMKDFTTSAKGMNVESAKQVTSFAALAGSMHGIGTEAKSGSEIYQTYAGAMQKAMGDATGLNVALMIGGENAGNTAKAISAVTKATADADGSVMGFKETQENLNAQLDDGKAAIGSLVTSIGLGLIPLLTPLVKGLAEGAQFLAQHKVAATALATVIGVVLVGALGALIVKFAVWAATSAAGFAADTAKGAVWVATKLAQFDMVVARSLWAATTSVAQWTYWEAVWYTTAVVNGAKWLAVKTAQGVSAVAGATARAVAFSAAWVAAEVRTLASATSTGAVWVATKVAQGVSAAASAVVNAAASSAAWVAANARMLASQLAEGVAWLTTWIAQGVAAAASSVVEAAVAAAAWVAANLAMIVATGGIVLAVGAVIAIGYLLIKNWDTVKQVAGEVWNAVTSAVFTMYNAVAGAINGLIGMFSNAASWLLSAGYNIVVGLWNGIASGWSWLEGKVSSLASSLLSTAKSALGISSPSRRFADEVGAWIAPGVAQGLEAEAGQAVAAAQKLAGQVVGAMSGLTGSADFTVSGGGFGAVGGSSIATGIAAAAGAGSMTNINVNVGGHIWSTQDLVNELQKQLLRHNTRNTSNATNYSFA